MTLTKEQIIENCKLCIEWHEADEKFPREWREPNNHDWNEGGEIWNVARILYRKKPQPKTRVLTQDDILNSSSQVYMKGGINNNAFTIDWFSEDGISFRGIGFLRYRDIKCKDIFINDKWQKGVMIDE